MIHLIQGLVLTRSQNLSFTKTNTLDECDKREDKILKKQDQYYVNLMAQIAILPNAIPGITIVRVEMDERGMHIQGPEIFSISEYIALWGSGFRYF